MAVFGRLIGASRTPLIQRRGAGGQRLTGCPHCMQRRDRRGHALTTGERGRDMAKQAATVVLES